VHLVIAGRYEELDDGLARDLDLGRVVRIRWIESPDVVDDPRISHPSVVRVYDVGEHEGRRFAVIEHIHGLLPLALAAPLPPDTAVYVGLHAARALAAAHALGLVHMGEILVRDDGVPKLAGFRRGDAGPDVRALAEALNDAAPALPPLHGATTDALIKQLEEIRPTVAEQVLTRRPSPRRRSRTVVWIVAALALLALVIGLLFAFRGGATKTNGAAVMPVPHAATAEQQARNLSAWLARYSSP
jgi:hypothetical protein